MSMGLRFFAAATDIVGGAVDKADTVGMGVGDIVEIILRVVLWIVGILSVAMIIYGGVKYVMSQGDPAKTTAARKTITFAIVGVIVAILAHLIVSFVVDSIGNGGVPGMPESSESEESTGGEA